MSIEPHSPLHRGEIAELFIRDAAMLPLRGSTLLHSVRSHYDLTTTIALPRQLCHLGIVNLGASASLPLRS